LTVAKLYVNNALFIANISAKFWLNLLTQAIVTGAFVKSPQDVKCPVLSNRTAGSLFNPDSVHGSLKNCAVNFLAQYFSCFSSLIKAQ